MPTTFNLRVTLWVLLGMALFLNYQTWLHDYPLAGPTAAVTATAAAQPPLDSVAPTINTPTSSASPPAAPASAAATTAASAVHSLAETATSDAKAPSVHVRTDVLDVEVSLAGGELKRVDLLAYPQEKNKPDVPVRLLNDDSPTSLFVVESGLAGTTEETTPTHLSLYQSEVRDLTLGSKQSEVQLPLTWTDGNGITVIRTLTFRRGEYRIGLDYKVQNASASPWSFAPYVQILRYNAPVERSYFRPDTYAYKGPAFFDGQKFAKLDLSKNPTLNQSVKDGWFAATQHDFVAAVVPASGIDYRYQLQTQGNEFLFKAQAPLLQVAAGAAADSQETLFVGPKIQKILDEVHPRLDLVADYGTLRTVAQPLFWLLDHVHSLTGNWGWAIVIVTLLIKLLFYPLAETSGKSMARMKALAPRMNALRETHKDDREKLNQAMMEMYRREKVNPLGGCLPTLIQIPVFFAYYWVLRDSVEMRQAPFMLWINDLSVRDPYFVLPAIMAAAMFVQYKINPQVGDPAQQKIFAIMPFAMSATFAFFPAGLVLYYVTNTLLTILQQWNINRRIEAASRAKR
jgi:YidC/Oxa1 family membrane protein insertase